MSSEKTVHESVEQQENEKITTNSEQSCEKTCAAVKSQLLRVTADFQNFKSRIEKERMQYIQIGHLSVVEKLLPIVDDVDRAISEARKKDDTDQAWLSGFDLIAKSLCKLLDECGVKLIEQNSSFDPELHEALAQVENADYESGAIVQVMQKGFMIGERVLRPVKVTVAK